MKRILLLLLAVVSYNANAQIAIFGSYKIDHATVQTALNVNDHYRWIKSNEGFVMRFPQTSDGIENLNQKLHYILLQNNLNLDEPSWDKTDYALQFKKEKSLTVINQWLTNKKIVINKGWKLEDYEIEITLFSGGYYILIK